MSALQCPECGTTDPCYISAGVGGHVLTCDCCDAAWFAGSREYIDYYESVSLD